MKALKILSGSTIIALLLITALALPVWYVYRQGNRFVQESEQSVRNRALEMGITLNTLSGESLYYDNLIALSHTMHMIVRQSQTRQDPFEIREIFLVDNQGKLIAHSDISRMAADSRSSFDKNKFPYGQIRFKGDPLSLEVTQRVRPDSGPLIAGIGAASLFERLLTYLLPDLTASDYHLSGSVYMPDEALPSGTLHIVIHNRNAASVLAQYSSTVLQASAVAVLGAFALWIIFTVVLTVMIMKNPATMAPPPSALYRKSQGPETGEYERPEEIKVNDAEFDPLLRADQTSISERTALEAEQPDEISDDSDLEPAIGERSDSKVAHLHQYRERKKTIVPSEGSVDHRSKIYDAVPLDRI
jgi:uncharacterized membrane protein